MRIGASKARYDLVGGVESLADRAGSFAWCDTRALRSSGCRRGDRDQAAHVAVAAAVRGRDGRRVVSASDYTAVVAISSISAATLAPELAATPMKRLSQHVAFADTVVPIERPLDGGPRRVGLSGQHPLNARDSPSLAPPCRPSGSTLRRAFHIDSCSWLNFSLFRPIEQRQVQNR